MKTRLVFPEVPPPSSWLPYLEPALDAQWYTNFGPVCRQFECRLETMFARPSECAVSMSNATSGLSACLIAEHITGPVLCPAFTFQATAGAILGANCTPVIVDCDPTSGVISTDQLRAALHSSGAQAAMVLSPYGFATDFTEHAKICAEYGALLVIDNAAGLGIDRSLPQNSDSDSHVREVFSLHATKPFGIGEGGVVFGPKAARPALEAAVNFGLPSHTATGEPKAPYWGVNGKLPEIGAAIGLAVADGIAARVVSRQQMAARWLEVLEPFPVGFFTKSPQAGPWQCFPILMPNEQSRDNMVDQAAKRGIELRKYYFPSLGTCRGMQRAGPCPNAESLSRRAVVFPIRSAMPEPEQHQLIQTVATCLSDCLV